MIQFFNKKMSKKRKGFTLIELIVVIAILGILAAIAIPRLTGASDNARTNTHYANAKTLKSAANIAIAENGSPTAAVLWNGTDDQSKKYIDDWPKSPYSDDTRKGHKYSVSIAEDTGDIKVHFGAKGDATDQEVTIP